MQNVWLKKAYILLRTVRCLDLFNGACLAGLFNERVKLVRLFHHSISG